MRNKIKVILSVVFFMLIAQPVLAEDDMVEAQTYRSAEVGRMDIKVAADGTGIIKNFSCRACGFKILRITPDTQGYLKDELMSVLQLVKQAKADVGGVRYALDSNAATIIQFSY